MGIRLSEDEAWDVVRSAHTGILTTLRGDGAPVALPVWYAVEDRTVVLMTPITTKKVARVRRDSRASFLVEGGTAYAELYGVHLSGHVEIVDDADARARIDAAVDDKYASFRPAAGSLPPRAQAFYAQQAFLRFVPEGKILTWDNTRLGLPKP